MYRFFVSEDQIQEGYATITGEDVNHIKNVLRMKPGEEIRISDGKDSDYYCIIREMDKYTVRAQVCYREHAQSELPARIFLFQGLPKGDKMELIIQKAVELGVWQIIPVAMKRSVVKLDEKKAAAKVRRWSAIAESAAKQSKRVVIPQVQPVMTYEQALASGADLDVKLLPYENEEGMENTRSQINGLRPGMDIGIFIGPEGGFEEAEVALAQADDWNSISLGRRILRTETAGMALLSILMYHLEM